MSNNIPRRNSEGYSDPTPYEAMKSYKDPRRQLQGMRSKSWGSYFEELINNSCEYYRLTGQGEIEKTPEPMKPVKSLGNGKFEAFYEKCAQPDYKGTLPGGRAVMF